MKKKEHDNNQNKDIKRYLGALSEMHGETLKGIKEGFMIVNRKLDDHTKKLDSHSEMIGGLMEDTSILKSDTGILKDNLSTIKSDLKKKVDYDEFLALVKRVQKIEAKR